MEPNNLPVMAKKFWSNVRAAFFMLRQGICKRKLMLDLNLMLKRGKIAGKAAIHNLMFHHGNHHLSVFAAAAHRRSSYPAPPNEYEFSCSNSPAYNKSKHSLHFPCAHAPATDDGVVRVSSFIKALEMHMVQSKTASPALPGFGRTPLVRQLRVTDSPFPLRDAEADCHVDEAAEEFISKFYKDLRRQSM